MTITGLLATEAEPFDLTHDNAIIWWTFQVKSSKYGQNTVIFGLIDGYYSVPNCLPKEEVSWNRWSLSTWIPLEHKFCNNSVKLHIKSQVFVIF